MHPIPGMRELFHTGSRARLRTWLAVGYTLFIVYGSLSPFSGWREQGLDFIEVLRAPFQLTYTGFDAVINLLAYLPFGFLVGLTLRARFGALPSVTAQPVHRRIAVGQHGISADVPALAHQLQPGPAEQQRRRIGRRIAGGQHGFVDLVLFAADTLAQRVCSGMARKWISAWLCSHCGCSARSTRRCRCWAMCSSPKWRTSLFWRQPSARFIVWESSAVTLNLLMLGTLLLTLLRVPQKVVTAMLVVLALVALAKFIAAALLLKSWALLLWINSEAVLGMLLGVLLLTTQLWLPRARAIGAGRGRITGLLCHREFRAGQQHPISRRCRSTIGIIGTCSTITAWRKPSRWSSRCCCCFTCGASGKYNPRSIHQEPL